MIQSMRCRLWPTSQAPEQDVAKVAANSGLDCLVENAGPYYAGFADEYATWTRPRNPGLAGTRVMWIFTIASLRCSRSARSALDRPFATSFTTSSSRPVSCLPASAATPSGRVFGRSPQSGSG